MYFQRSMVLSAAIAAAIPRTYALPAFIIQPENELQARQLASVVGTSGGLSNLLTGNGGSLAVNILPGASSAACAAPSPALGGLSPTQILGGVSSALGQLPGATSILGSVPGATNIVQLPNVATNVVPTLPTNLGGVVPQLSQIGGNGAVTSVLGSIQTNLPQVPGANTNPLATGLPALSQLPASNILGQLPGATSVLGSVPVATNIVQLPNVATNVVPTLPTNLGGIFPQISQVGGNGAVTSVLGSIQTNLPQVPASNAVGGLITSILGNTNTLPTGVPNLPQVPGASNVQNPGGLIPVVTAAVGGAVPVVTTLLGDVLGGLGGNNNPLATNVPQASNIGNIGGGLVPAVTAAIGNGVVPVVTSAIGLNLPQPTSFNAGGLVTGVLPNTNPLATGLPNLPQLPASNVAGGLPQLTSALGSIQTPGGGIFPELSQIGNNIPVPTGVTQLPALSSILGSLPTNVANPLASGLPNLPGGVFVTNLPAATSVLNPANVIPQVTSALGSIPTSLPVDQLAALQAALTEARQCNPALPGLIISAFAPFLTPSALVSIQASGLGI